MWLSAGDRCRDWPTAGPRIGQGEFGPQISANCPNPGRPDGIIALAYALDGCVRFGRQAIDAGPGELGEQEARCIAPEKGGKNQAFAEAERLVGSSVRGDLGGHIFRKAPPASGCQEPLKESSPVRPPETRQVNRPVA